MRICLKPVLLSHYAKKGLLRRTMPGFILGCEEKSLDRLMNFQQFTFLEVIQ